MGEVCNGGKYIPTNIHAFDNTYDELGKVKTQDMRRIDESGNTTYTVTYKYYFSGFRNIVEDPSGNRTIYYFDDKGRDAGEEDALGNRTTKGYDAQNRLIKLTDPRNNLTEYKYDKNNNLTRVINTLGKESVFIYDAKYRLTDAIGPLKNGVHNDYKNNNYYPQYISAYEGYAYTCDAQHTCVRDDISDKTVTAWYLDSKGNMTNKGIKTKNDYTKGLLTTVTDGKGNITAFTYPTNTYGNPATQTKTAAEPKIKHKNITYSYYATGKLKTLTDQNGLITTFTYHPIGQVKSITDPLNKTTEVTLYPDGNICTQKDRLGILTKYTYTPSDKVSTVQYFESGSYNTAEPCKTINKAIPDLKYVYNDLDQLLKMSDSTGTTTYDYDNIGRIKSVESSTGTVTYSHDDTNNKMTLTYPVKGTVNRNVVYGYDALNRLQTITNWLNQTTTYHYDDAGRLTCTDNFNGTATDYAYDNANRLKALKNRKASGACISDTSGEDIASYDFTDSSGKVTIDPNGNRWQVNQVEPQTAAALSPTTITYSFNTKTNGNKLINDGTNTFAYNNEGQTTVAYGQTQTFDYEHRLTGIGSDVQFSYDGAGNRARAVRNEVTTNYTYDANGNLLTETDGTTTKYYIYGNGLLAMVAPDAQSNDTVYNYHYNPVGSTVAITDQSQTIVNKYAYDPFGNILDKTETVSQPFKFVGQYGVFTESNGIHKMGARYYDSNVGRFISEDPIGFAGGTVNLYEYVGNNPVNSIDPEGLCGENTSGNWLGTGYGASSAQTSSQQNRPDYLTRYLQHLDKYLLNVGPYASSLLGGLWPKSLSPATNGRPPLLGSRNPLTSVPRGFGIPGSGSAVVRGGAATIGATTMAVGMYNFGVFTSGLIYAAFPGLNGL